METKINPARLREIREEAVRQAARSPFVDPRAVHFATQAIRRRGEPWAELVLGRRFDRRSLAVLSMPWLRTGELEALVLADVEEDVAAFAEIVKEP